MYKLITFDMYSATLDINGSSTQLIQEILNVDKESAQIFFKEWRSQQWNYLLLNNSMRNGFKSYSQITETILDYTVQKQNLKMDEKVKEELMNVWINFKPWPEAKTVLSQIKKMGYEIGMLSNGDTKMLAPLAEQCGVEFDYIFSAEQAKCYKPNPKIYQLPLEILNIKKEEMLHVAGSVFDVMGAKSAHMNCAWSNRFNDIVLDDVYRPDYNMKNLIDLLTILGG